MKQLVLIKYTTTLLKVMFADLKILENCRWNSIWKNDSLRQFQRSKDKNLRSLWRAFCYLHLSLCCFFSASDTQFMNLYLCFWQKFPQEHRRWQSTTCCFVTKPQSLPQFSSASVISTAFLGGLLP